MSDALELVHNWRRPGVTVDRMTAQAWEIAEEHNGSEVFVTQGCYNAGGVSASAGTHDRGGVMDGPPDMSVHTVRSFMKAGWCVFPRHFLPGVWNAHTHMVLYTHPHVASLAQLQKKSYANGWDGLGFINPGSGQSQAHWSGPCSRIIPVPKFKYEEDRMKADDWTRLHKIVDASKVDPATIAEAVLDHLINNAQPGPDKDFAGKSVRDIAKATYRNTEDIAVLAKKVDAAAAATNQLLAAVPDIDARLESIRQLLANG